jgi:hypothetical protein
VAREAAQKVLQAKALPFVMNATLDPFVRKYIAKTTGAWNSLTTRQKIKLDLALAGREPAAPSGKNEAALIALSGQAAVEQYGLYRDQWFEEQKKEQARAKSRAASLASIARKRARGIVGDYCKWPQPNDEKKARLREKADRWTARYEARLARKADVASRRQVKVVRRQLRVAMKHPGAQFAIAMTATLRETPSIFQRMAA